MFGSDSRCRNDWNGFIASSSVVGARPGRVIDSAGRRPRPSARRRTRAPPRCVSAMPSTAPTGDGLRRPWTTCASRDGLTRPIRRCARGPRRSSGCWRSRRCVTFSPMRPRDVLALARDRRRRADVRARAPSRATWLASVMNVPALAARPPAGATHTIIGQRGARAARRRSSASRRGCRPGCSSRDDDGGRAVAVRLRDPVLEVAGHDVVDDAGRRQHDHRRRVAARTAEPTGERARGSPSTSGSANRRPADVTGHR